MFEVGFTEILLICGLALIVLGPQKLPKLAAEIGRWVGRARGLARQFREQLDREVELGDIDLNAKPSPPPDASTSAVPDNDSTAPFETPTHFAPHSSAASDSDVTANSHPPRTDPDAYTSETHIHDAPAPGDAGPLNPDERTGR